MHLKRCLALHKNQFVPPHLRLVFHNVVKWSQYLHLRKDLQLTTCLQEKKVLTWKGWQIELVCVVQAKSWRENICHVLFLHENNTSMNAHLTPISRTFKMNALQLQHNIVIVMSSNHPTAWETKDDPHSSLEFFLNCFILIPKGSSSLIRLYPYYVRDVFRSLESY